MHWDISYQIHRNQRQSLECSALKIDERISECNYCNSTGMTGVKEK